MARLLASAGGKRERSTRRGEGSGEDGDLAGFGGERWVRGLERAERLAQVAELKKLRWKPPKKRISLNLDADVLAFFKEQGRGYQGRINEALRRVMKEQL